MDIKYEIEYYFLDDFNKKGHIETCLGESLDDAIKKFFDKKGIRDKDNIKIRKVTYNSQKGV